MTFRRSTSAMAVFAAAALVATSGAAEVTSPSTGGGSEVLCPNAVQRNGQLGPFVFGTTLTDMARSRSWLKNCRMTETDRCTVTDRDGILYVIDEGEIVTKVAERGASARLPYGVRWRDSADIIAGKLAAAGLSQVSRASGPASLSVCQRTSGGSEYFLEYRFSQDGRLESVQELIQYL